MNAQAAPARPLRRDAAENRRRLLDAAHEVFFAHGLDASVDSIAEAAGLGLGTFYRRFPTKDALIAELVEDLGDQLLAAAATARSRTDPAALPDFLRDAGELMASNRGCLSRLWDEHGSEQVTAAVRAAIAQLVADARGRGHLNPEVTPGDVTLLLWSMRGIIAAADDLVASAWRRSLDLGLAGMRSPDLSFTTPPISPGHLVDRTPTR